MLRRGLNATESCAEHSGTFNRRREGIEVEGKIPNVRTHENVRRIVFKYIFVFLLHINRQKEFGLYSLIHSFAGIQYINAKSSEVAMAPFQHFATDEGLAIQRVEPRMTSRELHESNEKVCAHTGRHVTHPRDIYVQQMLPSTKLLSTASYAFVILDCFPRREPLYSKLLRN